MGKEEGKIINLGVIILAAGFSDRMGASKPFLKWNKDITFLEKIIAEYEAMKASQIITVVNNGGFDYIHGALPKLAQQTELIINHYPEKGRMHSLILGLERLAENTNCFVQNVDNPFVTLELLSSMLPLARVDSYIVPVYKGKGGHPILIGANISQDIFDNKYENYSLKEVLKKFTKIEFETQDISILININSKDDYKKYFNSSPNEH